MPLAFIVLVVATLEIAGRRTAHRWSAEPREEDINDISTVTVLDLSGGAHAALTR